MIVKYLTSDKRLTFEIHGESQTQIFAELASIQEVFDSEHKCKCCNSTNLRYLLRKVTKGTKVFDFYEIACQECRARFSFGQSTTDKKLFPKRKNKQGEWLPNGGWTKYDANATSNDHTDDSNDSRDWD